MTTYLICCSPRSGSTLLTQGLIATGVAGNPNEYFGGGFGDEHLENTWKSQLGITDPKEYLDKVLTYATKDGVTGLKLHWHQCHSLVTRLTDEFRQDIFEQRQVFTRNIAARRPTNPASLILSHGNLMQWAERLLPLLAQRFGDVKYIWLRRGDMVAQAVSLLRAIKTDEWFKTDTNALAEIEFEIEELDECVRFCFDSDWGWHKLFITHGIEPYKVLYENFVSGYESTLRGIVDHLGEPQIFVVTAPALHQMADDWSTRAADRYFAEKLTPLGLSDRSSLRVL